MATFSLCMRRAWRSLFLSFTFWFVFAADVSAENLRVEIPAGPYEIAALPSGENEIRMAGFERSMVPGEPVLPAKSIMIALPPGAVVQSVAIQGRQKAVLAGKFNIPAALPPMPMNDSPVLAREVTREWTAHRLSVYGFDRFFPEQDGDYYGAGRLRKYDFIRLSVYPFKYNPVSKSLACYSSLEISIQYQIALPNGEKWGLFLKDKKADRLASRFFMNFGEAKEWYKTPPFAKEQTPSGAAADSTFDYVIITTDPLVASLFQLAEWKQSIGFSVKIATTSWISNRYPGGPLPDQIRRFLADKYAAWGIEYVLIAGDHADIPMKTCYAKPYGQSGYEQYVTPTDYYYADLTGDWDSDGDGYFGEYGQDNVDFAPEVAVGRIPWSDPVILSKICAKIERFEMDTGAWKRNALLLGAISNFANENHSGWPKTDGASLMEEIIYDMLGGWSYATQYEKEGLAISAFPCSMPLTRSNIRTAWSSQPFGMVNWWAHGSMTSFSRWVWSNDDGDNVPEQPPELTWQTGLAGSDTSYLNDDRPSIVFSCSCNNAYPDYPNTESLAKSLLRRGVSGIVASTRVSWYSIGWQNKNYGGNATLDYYFFNSMIASGSKVGNALFDSKLAYLDGFFWWGAASQQNMFDFCLYGDPSMDWMGVTSNEKILSFNPVIEWNFGEVESEQSRDKVFWIKNNSGAQSVEISGMEIAGADSLEFAAADAPVMPHSIHAGDTLKVTMRFSPVGSGSRTARLRIANDAFNSSPVKTIELKGTGFIGSRWRVPLDIRSGGASLVRTFGGDAGATDGYDALLDEAAAPPGQSYAAYFSIPNIPNYLKTDVRKWEAPFANVVQWRLMVANASSDTTSIRWNPVLLPAQGKFTMTGPGTIDMRSCDSLVFSGDQIVTIKYQPAATVQYAFQKNGWYMVSLPVAPVDSAVSILFPPALGGVAFTWDPAGGSYLSTAVMKNGKGYWIAVPSAATVLVSGIPVNSYSRHFEAQGWYMIGGVFGDTDFTNPDDNPDGMVLSPAFGWDSVLESYVPTTTLNEKQGYWIAVFGACDLTVGGSGGGTPKVGQTTDLAAFYSQYGKEPPGPPVIDFETGRLREVPKEYSLSQNYPNPFNPETTIRYQISQTGYVRLAIYNTMGQAVRHLVDGNQPAGYHQAVWNGRDDRGNALGSGMYLVRMEAGGFFAMKKILLMR